VSRLDSSELHSGQPEPKSEPVKAITPSLSNSSVGPTRVISSAAAFSALPTSRLPARNASASAAPEAEIPKCA
jgi:hypothetical protein